jgi:hypothetical protein
MRQLKVQVERVVRPICASIRRKMKMREELLGHLTASYQEALANGLKEEDAIRHALERFGDPAVLRAELQASVPAYERVLYSRLPFHDRIITTGHRLLWRRNNESVLYHALRVWLFNAICIAGLDALLFAFQAAALGAIRTVPLAKGAVFAAAFHGVPLVCSFLYVVFLDEIQDALQTVGSSVRRVARIGGWCLLSSGMTLGAGMSIRLIISNQLNCSSPQLFWEFVAACVLIPGMLVWHSIALVPEQKRREEWEDLVLDA